MLRIAAMNLMLHGVDDPDIHYQDTLSAGFTDRYPCVSVNHRPIMKQIHATKKANLINGLILFHDS